MVGHSNPEQSALHLPERLGETRCLFLEVTRAKQKQLNLTPSTLPAARQVQRPVTRYQNGSSFIAILDLIGSLPGHNPQTSRTPFASLSHSPSRQAGAKPRRPLLRCVISHSSLIRSLLAVLLKPPVFSRRPI